MALGVTANGATHSLIFQKLDRDRGCIVCNVDGAEGASVDLAYPLKVDDSYATSQFEIFLLANNRLIENDIYQVYDKSRNCRIGWCVPIQALASIEHSHVDNEHFLKYAYVATLKLISECPENIFKFKPDIDGSTTITLADFFPDCVAVLIVSLQQLPNGEPFHICDWVPALSVHGYVPLSPRDPTNLSWSGSKPEDVRMNLHPVSPLFRGFPFINTVFSDLVAFEANPFLRFFYMYQVVELVIEEIFKKEQRALLEKLTTTLDDTIKTKEVLEDAREIASEKRRLKILVNNYVGTLPDCINLRTLCNNFLQGNSKDQGEDVCDSLYRVRNILFHQYRDVKNADILENIVSELLPFMAYMLYEFTGERKK
jgi:hypothetical protein